MNFHYSVCDECLTYMGMRRNVLVPAITSHCYHTGSDFAPTLHRYLTGVHDRHMSGLSLAVTA